jgi:hypothetical protein
MFNNTPKFIINATRCYKGGGGGKAPKPPAPPVPTTAIANVADNSLVKRRRQASGLESTILTSGLGVQSKPDSILKTILGG